MNKTLIRWSFTSFIVIILIMGLIIIVYKPFEITIKLETDNNTVKLFEYMNISLNKHLFNNTQESYFKIDTNYSSYEYFKFQKQDFIATYEQKGYVQVKPTTTNKIIYLECVNSTLRITNTTLECVK